MKPLAVAIVDTSGSFRAVMIQAIEGQLRNYMRTFDVRVLEHDIQVKANYQFSGNLELKNPGGTCIKEALMEAMMLGPAIILIFTDGLLRVPKVGPDCPVFWYMIGTWVCPAKWGTALREYVWA